MTTTIERTETRDTCREALEFSRWHEECVTHLLVESGLQVVREPEIMGKTPDILARGPDAKPFVIECIARLPDPAHLDEMERYGHHVCNGNIDELHANVYSRLDHKATKYREIARHLPYVIALYDGTCLNSVRAGIDLAMSPYQPTVERSDNGSVKGKHYNTLWRDQEIPAALFSLYPHLSGLIYSRWPREHYYIPNIEANRPVSPRLLPFASVPALPPEYRRDGWEPKPATVPDRYAGPPSRWERELRDTSTASLHQIYGE